MSQVSVMMDEAPLVVVAAFGFGRDSATELERLGKQFATVDRMASEVLLAADRLSEPAVRSKWDEVREAMAAVEEEWASASDVGNTFACRVFVRGTTAPLAPQSVLSRLVWALEQASRTRERVRSSLHKVRMELFPPARAGGGRSRPRRRRHRGGHCPSRGPCRHAVSHSRHLPAQPAPNH